MHPLDSSLILKIITLSIFLYSTSSEGRWSTPDEADAIIDNHERDVTVKADGQSDEVVTTEITILNEQGRVKHGIQRLYHNGNIEKIEVLEATATYEGKHYTVPKNMIETKPMASPGGGFDQQIQTVVSYPHVGVGTKIRLKYRLKTKRQPLPKYYSAEHNFGVGALWKKAKLKIKSELPFFKVVNDPHKNLTITDSKDKKYQTLLITLDKPIYENLTNEASILDPELRTWIDISTFDKFEDFGNGHAENYEKTIHEVLPPLLEVIRVEAEKLTTTIDQLNKVSSLLAEKVRYMGDWRTVEGRFTPHSLAEITKSGVGDCKDFSVAMGAIVSKMGYTAHAVLVTRGEGYLPNKKALPSVSEFNHAMLKITDKEGKVYWIDPTNLVSMADGIFPDICNRPALVLEPGKSTLESIPNIKPDHAVTTHEKTLILKKNTEVTPEGIPTVGNKSETNNLGDILHSEGIVVFKGENAVQLAGSTLTNSPQVIGESLIHSLSKETTPLNQKIELPDLSSRIVKDLRITYAFDQENTTLFTNEGRGILLDSPWTKPYLYAAKDQIGTLFIGFPNHLARKIFIKDVITDHVEKLDFDIKSPWLEASRRCKSVEGGVELTENVTILKETISGSDVQSPEFKELKNKLKKYCVQVAAIIKTN